MPTIKVKIENKIALNTTPQEEIVCHNSDYKVEFDFDGDWDSYITKTAYFVYNDKSLAVPFNGNVCEVPVLANTTVCKIGVQAGDIRTTTSAYVKCKKAVVDEGGKTPEPPTESVYNQIVNLVNGISVQVDGLGATAEISVDENYVLTIALKNTDGNILSQSSVDLPIESLVVSARYDTAQKAIIFTLQSGKTLVVPIGDIVSNIVTSEEFNKLKKEVEEKQGKEDQSLNTIAKDIVGAINEIFAKSSANGKEGVGISSIEQTVTSTEDKGKNVITVTLTNGEKSQFSVLNGSKGSQGEKGDKGEPGISPHIGDNGNWFIGNIDTGVSASGGGNVEFTSIDPSMIIFPNGVKTTYPIGKVELVNGIGELISIGGNLNEFFEKFIDETPPNTIQPSVSLTFSQAKGYEVGTKVTPSYSASFNKGSYTYDDDTGVSVSAWSVKDTNNKILTTATGSFPELTVSDGINYKITATATHSAGIVPKTNTGNPYADGQIKAGAKSATSGALTGYRNTFYGTLTAKTDPTSSIIRGLATKSGKALANGNSFTLNVPVGSLRVIFAYPETLRDVTSVKDVNGMNAEISSSFVKITVPVEGANGYTAIIYKVYILDFAEANGTANKFTVTI